MQKRECLHPRWCKTIQERNINDTRLWSFFNQFWALLTRFPSIYTASALVKNLARSVYVRKNYLKKVSWKNSSITEPFLPISKSHFSSSSNQVLIKIFIWIAFYSLMHHSKNLSFYWVYKFFFNKCNNLFLFYIRVCSAIINFFKGRHLKPLCPLSNDRDHDKSFSLEV